MRSSSPTLNVLVCGDDRDKVISELGREIWHDLADTGFLNRNTVSCVGFARNLNRNTLIFVLPKAFDNEKARQALLDQNYKAAQLYRMVQLLQRVRKSTNFSLTQTAGVSVTAQGSEDFDRTLISFEAALALRLDFKKFGFYEKRQTGTVENSFSNPIDWKRTITKNQMSLGEDNFAVFETTHRKLVKNFIV